MASDATVSDAAAPPSASAPRLLGAPALSARALQRLLDAAFPGNRQRVARVTARGVQLAFAVDAAHDQVRTLSSGESREIAPQITEDCMARHVFLCAQSISDALLYMRSFV